MRVIAIAALAVVVFGCGGPPTSSEPVTGHDKLFDATYQHIAVIDSLTHKTERTLGLGVPAPDWNHLYGVSYFSLTDTDPATGQVRRSISLPSILPDRYELPSYGISGAPSGLSQNGHWLVLQAFDSSSNPPHRTRFMIVDTTSGATTPIDLAGTWVFDAISNDGQRLYLLEYLSAGQYRVRVYLVGEKRLDPQVVIDKSDPKESMSGVSVSGVAAPDGQFQFTVYARENEGAFIHALALDGSNIAYCIDLPGSGYSGNMDEFRWSVVLNPAATRLYAINALMGLAVEISIGASQAPQLLRTVHLSTSKTAFNWFGQNVEAKEFAANSLVISPDGKTLVAAAHSGLVWIDASTLTVRRNALFGWTVWSVGLSTDGKRLYAIRDNGMIAEVAMDSGAVITTFNPLEGQPMALLRVAAA